MASHQHLGAPTLGLTRPRLGVPPRLMRDTKDQDGSKVSKKTKKKHRERKQPTLTPDDDIPGPACGELSPDALSASAAAARTASSVSGAKPRYPALFADELVSSQMRPRSRCSVQTWCCFGGGG